MPEVLFGRFCALLRRASAPMPCVCVCGGGGHQWQLPLFAGLDWDVGELVALTCASILAQHDSCSGSARRPDERRQWDFSEDLEKCRGCVLRVVTYPRGRLQWHIVDMPSVRAANPGGPAQRLSFPAAPSVPPCQASDATGYRQIMLGQRA